MNNTIDQMDLETVHFTQQQQNTHSKYTQNLFQDRPHPKSPNKSKKILKD